MKNFILTIIFLIPYLNYAQNIEEKIQNEICTCLKEQFSPNLEGFLCFEPIALNYGNEIAKHLDSISALSNKKKILDPPKNELDAFSEFLENQFLQNQQYYFKNCGEYFQTILSAHNKGIDLTLDTFKPNDIEKLNESIEKFEHNEYLIQERGILHLKKKKYRLARRDFDKLIKKDSINYAAYLLKAISFEKAGKYNRASKVYNLLFKKTKESKHKISAELMTYLNHLE